MKQKSRRTSANLSDIAFIIFKKLEKTKPYGWFSKFVSEKLVEHYHKDFELKINIEYLNDITNKRNKLDEEIQRVKKKIRRCKK